jgi:hypothetical protein
VRILIGTVEIAGQIPILADAFRRLGHQVTSVIKERHAFFADAHYDVDITEQALPWPDRRFGENSPALKVARRNLNRAAILARVSPLIARHDLFIFLWAGTSLTERNREFPILKKLGKNIVSFFCGSDVRHSSGYSQLFAPLISNKSVEDWHAIREDFATEPLARPLRDMRMAERYADLIISVPNNSMLGVRPYQHFFVPVNLRDYQSLIPERDVPVVVHAPSDKGVKGTQKIVAALEQLRSEGVPFELRLLHGVPHQHVLSELSDADIAIDQLNLPLHGMFGLEAMASGCALATCNREDYEPFPQNRPIWHIDATNIHAGLKRLLTDKDLRLRLARDGRKYVEQHHEHVQVAQRILEALDAVNLQYDHYPTFFARSYKLEEGEVIPEYLKRMTATIVQRWGLPKDVDPNEMIRRGLMSAEALTSSRPVPRWSEEAIEPTILAV